jgi:hypothetical protein
MPIPMIAAGISRVHQKSNEFLRRAGLVKPVAAFIVTFLSTVIIVLLFYAFVVRYSSNTIADAELLAKFRHPPGFSSGAILSINGNDSGS